MRPSKLKNAPAAVKGPEEMVIFNYKHINALSFDDDDHVWED